MSPHFTRVVKELLGYKNAKYMLAGHKVWEEAMLPWYTEPEFVKMAIDEGIPHILVDLRSEEKAKKGQIPGSFNYPLSQIKNLYDNLPEDRKNTRVILYSDNNEEAVKAYLTLKANMYEKVSILNGGIDLWKAKGYQIESNTIRKEMPAALPKKLLPGAITVEEFKKLAKATPSDTVIVDVRSPEEYLKGSVPGALTIPTPVIITGRWKEIPQDKKVVIHCAAGNRALQVWRFLKDKGYKNVFWLDGKPPKEVLTQK
ncbi:rhodanese-like domain-containing protein [Dissulfurispira thermophila]|nr:rhodanese-like domain-containing protein [Dissulfurispira thermophila]